jgi:hypothetical protein
MAASTKTVNADSLSGDVVFFPPIDVERDSRADFGNP